MNAGQARYTPHAQTALLAAVQEAKKAGNNYVGPEHLFLAILGINRCRAVQLTRRFDLSPQTLEQELRTQSAPGLLPGLEHEYAFTLSASVVLKLATEEAKKPGPNYPSIGTQHLLLGVLLAGDNLPARVLQEHGVTAERVRQAIAEDGG